jgi:hypothetical protein
LNDSFRQNQPFTTLSLVSASAGCDSAMASNSNADTGGRAKIDARFMVGPMIWRHNCRERRLAHTDDHPGEMEVLTASLSSSIATGE